MYDEGQEVTLVTVIKSSLMNMRPYAVYVPLCVKAIISNLILYLKRKEAHRSQSSTRPQLLASLSKCA